MSELPLYETEDGKLIDTATGLSLQQIAALSDTSYQARNATKRAWLKRIDKNLVLDTDLSDKYTTTVFDRNTGNVFISHRGTKPTDVYDLHADAFIAAGTEGIHPRFRKAQSHLDKVKDKYKDSHITLSSHSLGGTIARNLGRNNDNLNVYAFNPGSATSQVRDTLNRKKYDTSSTILNLHITGDPISTLSFAGPEKTLAFKKNKNSAHSLSNFLDEDLELA